MPHAPRLIVIALASLVCAIVLFAPWALWVAGAWHAAVEINSLTFQLSPTFPLLLVREISGGGYACSLPLLLLAIVGCRSRYVSRQTKAFLLLAIASSIVCAIAADALFHYYFAIRQLLYLLIPLALLAGQGATDLYRSKSTCSWTVLTILSLLFAGACIAKDVRSLSDRSDDWASAARGLSAAGRDGYCIALPPGMTVGLYAVFAPELEARVCPDWSKESKIVYPVASLTSPHDWEPMRDRILRSGFREERQSRAGGTTLLFFERDPLHAVRSQ